MAATQGVVQTFGGQSTVGGSAFTFDYGSVTINTGATGNQTATVSTSFPTSINHIVFGFSNLQAGAVVAPANASAISKTGFTVNVNVTTGAAGTVTVDWFAIGN